MCACFSRIFSRHIEQVSNTFPWMSVLMNSIFIILYIFDKIIFNFFLNLAEKFYNTIYMTDFLTELEELFIERNIPNILSDFKKSSFFTEH